jgi:hypothetical protein
VGIFFFVTRRDFPHVIGKFLQSGAQPSLVVPFLLLFAFVRFEIFVISGMNASTIWSIALLMDDIESDPRPHSGAFAWLGQIGPGVWRANVTGR